MTSLLFEDRSPRRILIVRLSAIGDVIHGLPVACALRDRFPRAHIGWIVEGRAGDLLAGHDAIDELFRVPRGWLRSPSEVARVRYELKRRRFEVAIDLQGLTKSALAARLSGAPHRIGYDGSDGRELSRWLNNCLVLPESEHVIDRALELLEPLGIEQPSVGFRIPNHAAANSRASEIQRSLIDAGRFAVLNVGAGWPSKRWSAERLAAVAVELRRLYDMPSMVTWAGDEELLAAESVVARSRCAAQAAPATSLTELAALCRRAAVFISADTGPLHLAAAVGTPCVGLFGPVSALRNGPYGAQHVALQKACLLGGSRQRRNADNTTMLLIEPRDVIDACQQILGGRTGRTAA